MRSSIVIPAFVFYLANGRRQYAPRKSSRMERESIGEVLHSHQNLQLQAHDRLMSAAPWKPSEALATVLLVTPPFFRSHKDTPMLDASRFNSLTISRNRRYLHGMSDVKESDASGHNMLELNQNPVDTFWSKLTPRQQQLTSTLQRVGFPTILAFVLGFFYFDELALYIRSTMDLGTIRILQADDSQFMQNFITVVGLLFSILAGNAYSSLYEQQESIYFALFQEVSEAKSLLEQTTLVCQGRPFYQSALACMRDYVKNDLRRLDVPSAQLLSSRPMEDPLESIMYMTSVGVPSIVYETVKNLRQARGTRLGATQRKFPFLGIVLLYLLAFLELLAFPLLSAATADMDGVLNLQAFLFACLAGAVELVLRIIQELWQSSGGVFNVDDVLRQMVMGLEEELEFRSKQAPPMEQFVNSATLKSSAGLYSGMVPMPMWADRGSDFPSPLNQDLGVDSVSSDNKLAATPSIDEQKQKKDRGITKRLGFFRRGRRTSE